MSTEQVREREADNGQQEEDDLSPTDELYRISEATNDDGTVDVSIHDWQKTGHEVTVEFILPTGESETEQMDWPMRDDPSEYKFVRVVEAAGYGLVTAEELRGSNATVQAKRDGKDWCLHVPEPVPLRHRVANHLPAYSTFRSRSLHFFLAPLIVLLGLAKAGDPTEPGITDSKREYEELMHHVALAFGLFAWFLGLLFLLALTA